MVRQQRQLVRALTRSGGQPLSDLVRRRMEPVVGLDLGPVRVHTDAEAQQATSALGARAATSGHSIVFGRGESPADQALLAHELVHVRQQAEGRTLTLRGLGGDLAARESLEAEAAGQRVVGQSAGTAERAAPSGEVVQAQMAGPEPRRYTITMTFPGLLPATATAVSADEALKLLRHFVTRLGGMIQVGMSALEDARKLREDQWVVGAVSDLLAWQSLPAPEIWDQAIALFSRAGDLIRARDVSRAAATVQQGISAYQAAYDAVTAYREGMSRGAGRAIVGLEVAEVAGAVAATVATGGLAGEGLLATAAVAGGTAGVYGAAQQTAGQVGEMQAGMRHEFDFTAIARRGATDAVAGLVGAFVGGALTRYAQRWFGSYLGMAAPELLEELGKLNKLPGPLPRDFFLTRGQRLLAEFLGGVGSTPLVTATRVVFERTLGTPGRWPTADEFTQQVVQEMAQGGAMQILMTFLLHRTAAGRARRREAAAPPAEPVRTRVRPAPAPPPARGSEPTQASARAAEPSAPAPLPESASTPARAPGPAAPGAARALEPPAPVPPSAGEAAAPEPTLAVEPAAPAPAASELEPAEAHSTKPPGPGHPGGPQARPAVTAESLLEMFTTLYRRPGPPKEAIRLHSSLDSFEAAYRAALPPGKIPPPGKPLPLGFHDPKTGLIHLPPNASMETALHEALHWSRSNFGARKVLGAFWEEGLTEHLMQLMTGPRPTAYRDNIAFVGEVEAIVGRRVLQDAYLHGVWDRLTTRLEQHFGRPETVERFLETIRRVGPRGENPAALARARAMLRAGSGGGVPGPAAPAQGGSGGGP